MKKQLVRLGFGVMAWVLCMGSALAEMPKTVNLQSVVYDPDGNVTTASSVSVSVRVVDELGNIFFQEDHNDVPVVKGAMNLVIGESSGGIPADALDPTTARKFMDVQVNGTNPFDILPLSAVPYALWADKAVSVAKDGVTADSIKEGAIEPRHLSKTFDIGTVGGVVTEAQIPATIVRQETFNLHTSSATAHTSATITNTAFPVQLGDTVQVALETLYNGYAQEVANRIASVNSLTTTVNGIQSDIGDMDNTSTESETLQGRINKNSNSIATLVGKVANHEGRLQALEAAPYDSNEHALGWGKVTEGGAPSFSYPTGAIASSSGGPNPIYSVTFARAASNDDVMVTVTALNPSHGSIWGTQLSPQVSNVSRTGFNVTCYGPPNGGGTMSATPCGFHWIAFGAR